MLDVLTLFLAVTILLIGPPWLMSCLTRASHCDDTGDALGALNWTLAALLSAYGVALATLVLLIEAIRQTSAVP